MQSNKTKTKEETVLMTFNATKEERKQWKEEALLRNMTLTELIKVSVGIYLTGESANKKLKLTTRQEEQVIVEMQKERLEMMEALLDAETHCWPCGEIRKITKEEKLSGKFGMKLVWVDEAGLCYDDGLYCWDQNGTYNAKKQVGGGKLTWMRTLGPALKEGWRPKEPMSWLTAKRVLHAYEGIEGQDQEFIQKLEQVIKQGEQNGQ